MTICTLLEHRYFKRREWKCDQAEVQEYPGIRSTATDFSQIAKCISVRRCHLQISRLQELVSQE